MIDLSHYAGFPLDFDPPALKVVSGDGIVFKRSTRSGRDVQNVMYNPDQIGPDEPVYMMDILDCAPEKIQTALNRYALTFSLVLLPPLKIGKEFVKTAGHYHPPIPGTILGYPEVYTQLYGKLLLVLQRRSGTKPEEIMDYKIFEMTPGFVITIPPNYAHCLINPTNEPALMAGLYGKNFKPDYDMTRSRRGLAYYFLAGENGDAKPYPNPNYLFHPEIEYVKTLEGTVFAPDYPAQPVWTSFLQHPADFAFLTEAQAAENKFPDWA